MRLRIWMSVILRLLIMWNLEACWVLQQDCTVECTGCNEEKCFLASWHKSIWSHVASISVIISSGDDFFGTWFEQNSLWTGFVSASTAWSAAIINLHARTVPLWSRECPRVVRSIRRYLARWVTSCQDGSSLHPGVQGISWRIPVCRSCRRWFWATTSQKQRGIITFIAMYMTCLACRACGPVANFPDVLGSRITLQRKSLSIPELGRCPFKQSGKMLERRIIINININILLLLL